jgi:RHH-type proline utilization regulon transcriptional repressor/proline dehydrogenase/delta 1-pyrroline-5-carboxylate dehydrogenase
VVLRLDTRDHIALGRAEHAAQLTGVNLIVSIKSEESEADFAARLPELFMKADRLRTVGVPSDEVLHAANAAGFNWIDAPFTASGRLELRFWMREQAVTQTRHRYGQISEFQPDARRGL